MPDVVEVWRSGGYGTTVWLHRLSCGHVHTARRRSTKAELPCAVCDQLSMLPPPDAPPPDVVHDRPEPVEVQVDETARSLESEAKLKAAVAARLGVPAECVTVVETPGRTEGVVVHLSLKQVDDLLPPR